MLERLERQRTYGLVGHSGGGKTSLAEMFLFLSKATDRLGKVEQGNTCLDFEPEEVKRRGSIQPGFAYIQWNKHEHYLVDLPGDLNFSGDIQYLLTSVDSVLFVIDGLEGIKPLSKRIWAEVDKSGLPVLIWVNKVDLERANFEHSYASIQENLGIKTVVLFWPVGSGDDFKGVVNLLDLKFYDFQQKKTLPLPAELKQEVTTLRTSLLEDIAETSEELMEKYLEQGSLNEEELLKGLKSAMAKKELVPVVAGSAWQEQAVGLLLDLINQIFFSPLERPKWQGEDNTSLASDPDGPATAFVCKTMIDPFAGQVSVLRVLAGKIMPDLTLVNAQTGEKEKLNNIFRLQGKERLPVKTELGPGAILGVAKLKNTHTGDTLRVEDSNFVLKLPELPVPVVSYALTAKKQGDEDKIFAAVQKILEEDPTLKLERNPETGDMLLSGMGQLHLETVVEKVKNRYNVDIALELPHIAYRETIKAKAEVQGKYKKQTGGHGQYGDCWIRVEPLPRGGGYEFVDEIVGGVIPKQYIPAVDAGIQEAAAKGFLAGYPVIDFKVTLYDGSYHSVDSSELAFKVAGSLAFKKAMEKCKPILLEPVMKVVITVPDQYMGDVISDISGRRGKVLGSESNAGYTEIQAEVPMAEMLTYAQTLTSMTSGQGIYTMEFAHYAEVPPPLAEKIINENKQE